MMNIVDEIFNRVVFDQEDRAFHFELYGKVKDLANEIDGKCSNGPDKTLAFRSLHSALMHIGASLSRHNKYKVEKENLGVTE